jgi:hypothetical protein
VVRRLNELPDEFLDCRDMMHAWKRTKSYVPVGENPAKAALLLREMECVRCGTIKEDTFSARSLERVSTQYKHPTGYLIKGNTVPKRQLLARRAVVERARKRRA